MNKINQKLWIGVGIAVLLLILIWIRVYSDQHFAEYWTSFQQQFQSDKKGLMLIILLLAPASWIIESLKWRFLLLKVQRISLWTAFASVLTGMSFAIVSPGKSGDFAGRILYLRPNTRWRGVIASLVGSFAHILVTFFMAILGFAVLLLHHSDWRILALFLTALILGLGIAFLYFRINQLNIQAKNRKSWWGKFLLALKVLRRYHPRDLIKVLLFSLLKFCVYTTQFVLVTYLFGSTLGFGISFFTAAAMFWIIMMVPSMFVSDIIVRGFVAKFLFVDSGLIQDSTAIFAGTYIIWLTNWVLPSLAGALVLLINRLFLKEKQGQVEGEEEE